MPRQVKKDQINKQLIIGDLVELNCQLLVIEMSYADNQNKKYYCAKEKKSFQKKSATDNKKLSIFDSFVGVFVGTEWIPVFDHRVKKKSGTSRKGVAIQQLHFFIFGGEKVNIHPNFVDVIYSIDSIN